VHSRPIARAFAVAGVVAILALGAVSMASAAAPIVTNYHTCYPDGESGLDTICYTIHDVEKYSEGKNGSRSLESGTMLIEYYDPQGDLLWSDKTRWHTTILEKDGEWQVYKDQTKVTFEEDGETCTAVMNVTYANGETRHLGPEWQWVCK
jgi:hypothetical protein